MTFEEPITITADDLAALFPKHGLLTVCTGGIWDRLHVRSLRTGTINIHAGYEPALIAECRLGLMIYQGPFMLYTIPDDRVRLGFGCLESFFVSHIATTDFNSQKS